MHLYHVDKPFALLIFGASGDLAKLKLFPALYSLAEQKRLPKEYYIIGYARTKIEKEIFQKEFADSIKHHFRKNLNEKILQELSSHVSYVSGQYNKLEDFKKLRSYLSKITQSERTARARTSETGGSATAKRSEPINKLLTTLAYFSVPPQVFQDIIENLGETKRHENEDLRLILEKPFGEDANSARELFHFVARYFKEENVYLLDHYLGKTAVQSLLHLRHSNRLINMMMKGPEVSNIQITAFEKIGVTSRAGYFDQVGTIKDMVQSHLMQILALITMSIPITENAESLHREKYSILSALKFIESKNNIVLGQYAGYTEEKDIPENSKTETFAAMRLFIDRESWYKTPIYIRTGKKLHEKHTYIVVELKKFAFQPKNEEPNRLIFELQPDEKINIRLVNKQGRTSHYREITTSDTLACSGDDCLPEHSMLLLDVIRKRRLNFLSFEEIIATWQIIDNILAFIQRAKLKPEKYKDSSPGPKAQDNLTAIDDFKWFDIH
ncbi:glucose-6-phosphate dehydrogenase (NADP(+)) [Candidatus Peregrinibacteria bacterium]|nr:glucose-6-phosphate dehydrogenase (NADP(+)) [Candidatus Peregrinibacteria bacterium]